LYLLIVIYLFSEYGLEICKKLAFFVVLRIIGRQFY